MTPMDPEGVVGEVQRSCGRGQVGRGISPDDVLARVHHEETVVPAVGDQEQPRERPDECGIGGRRRRRRRGGTDLRQLRAQGRRQNLIDRAAPRAADQDRAVGSGHRSGVGHGLSEPVTGPDRSSSGVDRHDGGHRVARCIATTDHVDDTGDRDGRRLGDRSGKGSEGRDGPLRGVERRHGVDRTVRRSAAGDHDRGSHGRDGRVSESRRQATHDAERRPIGGGVDLASRAYGRRSRRRDTWYPRPSRRRDRRAKRGGGRRSRTSVWTDRTPARRRCRIPCRRRKRRASRRSKRPHRRGTHRSSSPGR